MKKRIEREIIFLWTSEMFEFFLLIFFVITENVKVEKLLNFIYLHYKSYRQRGEKINSSSHVWKLHEIFTNNFREPCIFYFYYFITYKLHMKFKNACGSVINSRTISFSSIQLENLFLFRMREHFLKRIF